MAADWVGAICSAIRSIGGVATESQILHWIESNTTIPENNRSMRNSLNKFLRRHCLSAGSVQYAGPNIFHRSGPRGSFSYSIIDDDGDDWLGESITSITGPPADNNGWNAEMFVVDFFRNEGWQTSYVGHKKLGYDIEVKKSGRTLCVEVKSSVGKCHPTLTKNEHERLQDDECEFVLAILENFDPMTSNEINWIGNSKLKRIDFGEPAQEISFPLKRSSWVNSLDSFESLSKQSLFDF
jgi:hypothetical protein